LDLFTPFEYRAKSFFQLLWAFDFAATDMPDMDHFMKGHVLRPQPFSADLVPRSPLHATAIEEAYASQEEYYEKFNPY